MKHIHKTLIAGIFATTLLSGCSVFSPYTPPVQQGKIITSDMIQQVQPGMTEQQVQFILGTPDIRDPFATNQFVYYYSFQQRMNAPRESKQLVLTFKDNKLVGIAGDYPPPQEVFGTTPTIATPDLSPSGQTNSSTATPTSATDQEDANMPKTATQVNAPHQQQQFNPADFTTDGSDNSATPDEADTSQTPLSVNI